MLNKCFLNTDNSYVVHEQMIVIFVIKTAISKGLKKDGKKTLLYCVGVQKESLR